MGKDIGTDRLFPFMPIVMTQLCKRAFGECTAHESKETAPGFLERSLSTEELFSSDL